jgi:hypothetical protein
LKKVFSDPKIDIIKYAAEHVSLKTTPEETDETEIMLQHTKEVLDKVVYEYQKIKSSLETMTIENTLMRQTYQQKAIDDKFNKIAEKSPLGSERSGDKTDNKAVAETLADKTESIFLMA